ncbi:MAG: class I SAM-dependent methyltransferase [Acidobacteriota bacterium]|nr:class I SAM-dependent methyltransferase [Acidobacteriota bacterium]
MEVRNKSIPAPSDYDKAWSAYSARWDREVRKTGHRFLGDEWGTPDLTEKVVGDFVSPYLRSGDEVLEIGCGGGKYSEILASRDIRLVCGDVSRHMLERTKNRLAGRSNVRFAKLNGCNLNSFSDAAFDLIFSFDVFVHLDIEDTFSYLGEIRRTLKPSGYGVLHFANLISEDGWKKFETESVFNIGGHKHFDRFRFLTWEIVEKMVTHFDFRILDSWKEPWRDILVVFQKP